MMKIKYILACLYTMFFINILQANTINVTTTSDDGAGSLRNAIVTASDGDIINITAPGIITLSTELPIITKTITLNGYSKGTTISANNVCRIFTVQIATGTVTFNGLNILNGYSANGAAAGLYAITGNNGKVILNKCTFSGCNTTGSEAYGGAIATSADMELTNCTIYGNTAQLSGGALATLSNCTISVLNCTAYKNNATNSAGAGGFDITEASVSIQNSILAGNTADGTTYVDLLNSKGGFFNSLGNNLSNTVPFALSSDYINKNLTTEILLNDLSLDESGMWVCTLKDGSIAVNQANNVVAPATDQCGKTRIANADIGAVERQMSTPTVTTNDVTIYNQTTATVGGNVTDDGGAAVSERGIIYSSTNTTPTSDGTDVTVVSLGTSIGTFTTNIVNLTPNTTYYVRAYATNAAGTVYGNVIMFTTSISTELDNKGSNLHPIYPNPAVDGFFIDAGERTTTAKIYDINSRLLLTKQIQGNTYIDISSLNKGVYMVEANGKTIKLIKR